MDSDDSSKPDDRPKEPEAISPWSPEARNRPISWKAVLAMVVSLGLGIGVKELLTDSSGYYLAMFLAAVVAMLIVGGDKLRR